MHRLGESVIFKPKVKSEGKWVLLSVLHFKNGGQPESLNIQYIVCLEPLAETIRQENHIKVMVC